MKFSRLFLRGSDKRVETKKATGFKFTISISLLSGHNETEIPNLEFRKLAKNLGIVPTFCKLGGIRETRFFTLKRNTSGAKTPLFGVKRLITSTTFQLVGPRMSKVVVLVRHLNSGFS